MARRRVVVTGMGMVTPLGNDVETVWQRLLNGDCGIGPTTRFDASTFPTTFSGEVKDFKLADFLGPEAEKHQNASINAQYALAAAKMAWEHANLANAQADMSRVGVYLGGGEGPIDFNNFVAAAVEGWDPEANNGRGDLDTVKWAEAAARRLAAGHELEQDPNMAGAHVACMLGIRGPSFNTLTACAASTQAMGEATHLIRRGDADIILSGGTHSMLHPLGVTGFNRLTALSTRNDEYKTASRPFDDNRDGFVLAEGAAILILEEYEHAKARGATCFAEVAGVGSTADAFRVTDMHEEGRGGLGAILMALQDAGVQPQDIDYISAHGTSTEENDKVESLAITKAFGEYAGKVPVSSVKSMLGHLIAAAGATEAIVCCLAIRDQIVPPTTNYTTKDPNCQLDYVPNVARKIKVQRTLSNSFGFGGQNDTLVISEMAD